MSVNAAQVDWSIDLYDMELAGPVYEGMTVYVLTGANAGSLANYLTSGDYKDATSFNAALSSSTKTSASLDDWGYGSGTITGVDASSQLSVLILETGVAEGASIYWTSLKGIEGITYEAGSSSPGTLELFPSDFSSGKISYAAESVPEPTSGLLMLVGLAGLALRRRRA